MMDRDFMKHLKTRQDNSRWECEFCGRPFPWSVPTKTFISHLTGVQGSTSRNQICERVPEDVKEAAAAVRVEQTRPRRTRGGVSTNEVAVQRKEVDAECSTVVGNWVPTRILDACQDNNSNFEAQTGKEVKAEVSIVQRTLEERGGSPVVGELMDQRDSTVQRNKRQRTMPDVLPILSPVIGALIEKMVSVDVLDFFRRHDIDEGQLNKFVVGKQKQAGSGSDIKELEKLHDLQRRLCVEGLQNVMDLGDATGAILSCKQHLKELELGHGEDNSNCSLHQQRVLEIVDCKILLLPPVCRLASLERLTIKSCDGVTSIGSELHSMKKLRYLSIKSMRKWCEWISDGDDSETNFPLLQELKIKSCPKLRKALPSHLPSVAQIKIVSCEQLEIECFSLECFPMLKELKIWCCPKLVSFCKGRSPNFSSNLASLDLTGFPNLKVFPESRLCSNLEILRIRSCLEIEIFPMNLGVYLGGSNSKLRELSVMNCKKLFSRRHEWGLEMLPSLLTLRIGGCGDEVEETFPEKTLLLPSTLTTLGIGRFPNLKSLNYDGLQPLTSLRELEIWYCRKLQSLQPNQNQMLPTSLSYLYIGGCPLLTERCQPEKGVDWPFISHIPNIYLNDIWISD